MQLGNEGVLVVDYKCEYIQNDSRNKQVFYAERGWALLVYSKSRKQ
jgi:hypothetical protein